MPQKRNPDVLELIRGKTARVYAALVGMLTLTKGLPQAYNRDLQEDKIHLFSAHDTLAESLEIVAEVVRHSTFDVPRLAEAARRGFLDATCLAEYLVGRGVPFRQAHQHVGRLVALAEKQNKELTDLPLAIFRAECARIGREVYKYLGAANVVARYRSEGNAGPKSALKQIKFWRKQLATK